MQFRWTTLLMLTTKQFPRFVWYIFQGDVHEDTTAKLFKLLNNYTSGRLNWLFCVGVCTGKVAVITGRLSCLSTRTKELALACESTHCVIHREMPASPKLSPWLNSVLQDVFEFIKVYSLNLHLFGQHCAEMDAEQEHLLLHTVDGSPEADCWLELLSCESPCSDFF